METPRLLPWTDSGLTSALEEQRITAREQLKAAWQLHVERVEEQLAAGWKEQIDRVVEDRFAELAARVEEEFGRELSARIAGERETLRRETAEQLNQAARRLRQSESGDELHAILLDVAAAFCDRAVLFAIEGGVLRCAGARGLDPDAAGALLVAEAPLEASPAARGAVESLDTVVAMRTAGELSETLAAALGGDPAGRSFLFPVICRGEARGLLYADGDEPRLHTAALELLTALAGSALDFRATPATAAPSGLVTIAGQAAGLRAALPDWSALPIEDRDLHLRAQRFARVQVAEMRLYKPREVRSGRLSSNLYADLRDGIDAGREAFRLQFAASCPTMVDYFHLELVRTLANDDPALLGPDYPGPLV
jgi:hypothetical protein